MKKWLPSKSISVKPVNGIFVSQDKFLKLQHFSITEPMPPMSEDESLVLFVTSGEGSITINGVEFALSEGSLCWLQSYHTYTIEPAFGSTLNFSLCVYDYPLSSYLVMQSMSPPISRVIMQSRPVMQVRKEKIDIIRRLLNEFEAENDSYSQGSSMIKVATLGQIVVFFTSDCIKRGREPEPRPLGWTAVLYIAEHYREPLTSAGVAAEFGCTPAQLNYELRKISGRDFQQSLDRIRINIATGAMFFEDVSLSYLLSYSGFSTEASFYRVFKKLKGVSPNEYRLMRMCAGKGYYGMVNSRTVISALSIIQTKYAQPITQKNIAAELYISETLLSEKFRELFGLSVRYVIMLCRVRHSEALLLNTDLPLLDISMSVGFNSSKVFSRAFKSVNGMTPTEFRLMKGGKQRGKEEN